MSFNSAEIPTLPHSANDSLAFQYHGVDVHTHSRTQGLILATSEQEARLSLRSQSIVALKLSLVSAANPLVTAQSASAHTGPTWYWLAPWVKAKQSTWREQTLSLLATALDQAPLLQALAIVERQLTALSAPDVWPAALLVWRDGLAKGLSCNEALEPFANVWGGDWLAWVEVCELQGMPLAPLTPWIKMEQYRHSLQESLRPILWHCQGWGVSVALLIVALFIKSPHLCLAFLENSLKILIPGALLGGWVVCNFKKRLEPRLNPSAETIRRLGWAAWWIALHLQTQDTENLSPLEALQMAVRMPSARQANFLHHVRAAAEAGQPLEIALSQSSQLPAVNRLRFEAVQDSNGLRHAIEACWHHAEEKAIKIQLRWLIGLDILLALASVGLVITLMR
jgi:hypothetical protein